MEKNEGEKQRLGQSDLKDIRPDLLPKEPIISNKQYNRMDGKILKFYAIHDSQDRQCEMLRKFIIHVIDLLQKQRFGKIDFYFLVLFD
jgi:hypothetical protein